MQNRRNYLWPKAGILLCVAIASATVAAPPARAQDPAIDGEKSTAEQMQALAAGLLEREKAIADLQKKVSRNGDSAAADVLRSELTDQRTRFRREVAKLTDLVVTGEDAGTDSAQARELATRLLQADAKRIRSETADVNAQILELSEVVENGSPEEAADAENDRDRALVDSNDLLRQFHENLELQARLGIDVDAEVAEFEKRLSSRATFVGGSLKDTKEEITDISTRPGVELDPEAQKELAELRDRRDVLAESQRLNAKLMDEYELDTSEIRQGIISATGKISEDVLNKDVAVGLAEEWMADAAEWLRSNGASMVFQFLMFLLVLLAFWVVARIAKGAVRRGLNRSKVGISSLAKDFFIKSTGRVIMVLGLIIAIAQLGIEVAPLLAGLGIAGFVVGFALQDTLSNFASGMMILIYRPFDVGDVIEAGGISGKVHQMNLVSTMVLTFDNQLLIVPNTQIWSGVIRNVTHQDKRRVDLKFGIGYSDDIPHAEKILAEIVAAHEKVLPDPEPVIRLHELGESSVNFVVRPWSRTDDYWDVYWDVTREVKRRFDDEGISIPFPQRDVHVYQEAAEAKSVAEEGPQRSSTARSGQDVVPDDEGDA
ncbi:MAG: mechanosensitive ion channel domain-containing protein [Polyangiales bacterium]